MPSRWQGLRQVVAVEPGERAMVGWAAASLFLLEWAAVAVSNTADTLFLKRVGVDYLPVLFLVNSALLTGTTFAVGRLALRHNPRQLLTIASFALSSVLFGLWVLVLVDAPGIATTLALAAKQVDVLALLLFWMVLGDMMTSRQGKRLAALMTAGGTVGTIAGSFTSGPLGRLLGIPSLLAVAALAFALAALATVPLGKSAPSSLGKKERRSRVAQPEQPPTIRAFWSQSALFRVLVASSFLAGLLGPILYYEFSLAADLATRTTDGEQRLLGLYGLLRGWINVGVLLVQVAGSAALFRWLGVPLAAALSPLAYLAGFLGLSVRFGLSTAMPASMGSSVLDHTVFDPGLRILGALLPPRMRAVAVGLVQGPAKRLGAAVGSLVILIVVAIAGRSDVAMFAVPFAALWMGLALWLWRHYATLLLEAASVRDSDSEEDDVFAGLLDSGTLRALRHSLQSEDADVRLAACSLFAEAPVGLAVDALTAALPAVSPSGRADLVRTLERALSSPERFSSGAAATVDRLSGALRSATTLAAIERAKLVHLLGCAACFAPASQEVRTLLADEEKSGEPAVELAARVAGLRIAAPPSAEEPLDQAVAEGLASANEDARSIALLELRFELLRGNPRRPVWRARLETLSAQVFGTRSEHGGRKSCEHSVQTLGDVAAAHPEAVEPVVEPVLALAADDDAGVRAAVLRFLGNAKRLEYAALFAERLSSRSGAEAEAARAALRSLGAGGVDALLHALRHGSSRAREVAADMLRDVRVDRASLRGCLDRELAQCRDQRILLGVLDGPGLSPLVLQRLREKADESMLAALELLAAMEGEDRISHVSRCLGRGRNERDRTVLLEALETLLPPAERRRILPLLEDKSALRVARDLGVATGLLLPGKEEALARCVASQDALLTALLAATLEPDLRTRALPDLDVATAQWVLNEPRAGRGDSELAPETTSKGGAGPAAENNTMLTPVEKMLHLRTLDLFDGLTIRQLTELARITEEVEVVGGETILKEGEFDDAMYFIVRGTVAVVKVGQPVAKLGERDFFGEMAVFDGETRSATVTASDDVRLLRLHRNDLFEVMEDEPAIGVGICQTLVRRIRGLLEERSQRG